MVTYIWCSTLAENKSTLPTTATYVTDWPPRIDCYLEVLSCHSGCRREYWRPTQNLCIPKESCLHLETGWPASRQVDGLALCSPTKICSLGQKTWCISSGSVNNHTWHSHHCCRRHSPRWSSSVKYTRPLFKEDKVFNLCIPYVAMARI